MILDRPEQLLAALLVEAALGYPEWLLRRVGHPVTWAGRLIAAMDRRWNREGYQSGGGIAAMLVLLLVGAGFGLAIECLTPGWAGTPVVILIATTGLAQRSLWNHVAAVADPLDRGQLDAGRTALSRTVGRDTAALDENGVAAAAIETLAESFCDGIAAPAVWFLALGLPGLFAFKCISTADSMIGHRDACYELFGKASAMMDDVLNWVPARIAAVLICLAGGGGWRILRRDGRNHLSPNAGWPESAMAGTLGVTLGGGAFYDGEWNARQTLGEGPRPGPADLRRALRVFLRAVLLLWLSVGVLAWLR
ncbi:adenosylcobinamide-phosphate synthase CbiB [Novosphingobium sp.]|uniref:adenosylcobinamide-phosphate synthase CbiB n=1 Tax=Novosphingobium sp. TaxID=1874826 RepID=UPI003BAD6796